MQETVTTGKVVYEERDYFCKICGTKTRSTNLPLHWIVVRKTFNATEGPRTIGVYDSAECQALDVNRALIEAKKLGNR